MDLSNWMKDLNAECKKRPINLLAIPGSHDSLSYTIKSNAPLGPDAEPAIRRIVSVLGVPARKVIHKWCVTQHGCIHDQLNSGIRYFDIRVATKKNDKEFYFTHGMYGGKIVVSLQILISFLEDHEYEVIILDFQHFYGFNPHDHVLFTSQLQELFGSLMCPIQENLSIVTLDWMKKNGYKIIAIYRSEIAYRRKSFWPSSKWDTPWPETMSCKKLIEFLDETLANREENCGYVSQCLLTPTKLTVLRFCDNLHTVCARPAASACIPWLNKHSPEEINVAIADFVLDKDSLFPQTVIALNRPTSHRISSVGSDSTA